MVFPSDDQPCYPPKPLEPLADLGGAPWLVYDPIDKYPCSVEGGGNALNGKASGDKQMIVLMQSVRQRLLGLKTGV